jgi:hypothetical protein
MTRGHRPLRKTGGFSKMFFRKRLEKSSDRKVLVISMIIEVFWYIGLFLIAWYVAGQCVDVCAQCMNCTVMPDYNFTFNASNVTIITGGLV